MSRFLGRVGIGFLISFPITCILSGGVQDGVVLLLISIICTAGIGLVGWIPLWWFVGWVAILVVTGIRNEVAEKPVSQATLESDRCELPSTADPVLTAYISKAIANGMDIDEMTRRLQLNGWALADIQNAHQRLVASKAKPQDT